MLKTNQNAETAFNDNECPGCGLKKEEWTACAGEGFLLKGERYCCRGCALQRGCECRISIAKEVSLKPGVQVFDHGTLRPERRGRQLNWTGHTERRLANSSPRISLS